MLAIYGTLLAFPLGVLLALGRRSQLPIIRSVSIAYIELVRGVPLITVLFMASIMFALFMPEGISFDKLLRAQVAIILFNAAYIAEVVRGGLQALPRGQYEAAHALGLGYWKTHLLVILPQALKVTIPAQVNSFIDNFKDTSLVIIVSIFDFLYAVKQSVVSDLDWRHYFIEGYLFAMAVYWVFCYAMSRYSQWLERHLNRDHPGLTMETLAHDHPCGRRRHHHDPRPQQVVRRLPGAARHPADRPARRTHRDLRPVGLGEVDADPLHQPPGTAPVRHRDRRRRGTRRLDQEHRSHPQ